MNLPLFQLPFFTSMLILLVAARVLGEIFERFKQPAMIGEIMAGIILGPTLFNLIHRTEEIKVISELGIFLLVILAGLEINIDDILKSIKGKNIVVSLLAFFIPIIGGISIGFYFDQDIISSIFIGLCVAITALPVSVRILMDLGKLNSTVGQKIISIAIFDDVLALTFLGLIVNLKDTDMSALEVTKASGISLLKLVFFICILIACYLFIRKITNKGNYIEESLTKLTTIIKGKEPLFALFFAFILLFAMVTEVLGLHFIVGAFFASLLISEKLVGKENLKTFEKTTSNVAMGFLTPIFFAGIGLEFNMFTITNLSLLAAVLLVSFGSKIFGGFIGGKLIGLSKWQSITLGFGLNARGIMELVIANIAYKEGFISAEIFSILVLMGIITTLSTPILLKKAFRKIT